VPGAAMVYHRPPPPVMVYPAAPPGAIVISPQVVIRPWAGVPAAVHAHRTPASGGVFRCCHPMPRSQWRSKGAQRWMAATGRGFAGYARHGTGEIRQNVSNLCPCSCDSGGFAGESLDGWHRPLYFQGRATSRGVWAGGACRTPAAGHALHLMVTHALAGFSDRLFPR
jgi:hypothetical protein